MNDLLQVCVSAPGKVILHGEHAVVYDKKALAASLGLRTRAKMQELCPGGKDGGRIHVELAAFNVDHSFRLKDIMDHLLDQPLVLVCDKSQFSWDRPDLLNQPHLEQKIEKFLQQLNLLQDEDMQSPLYLSLKTFCFLLTGIFGSMQLDIPAFDLRVATELKISAGTGSSASYSVTLAALFMQYARLKLQGNVSKSGYKESYLSTKNLDSFTMEELEIVSKWALHAEKIIHGSPSGIDNTICTFGSMVEFQKGAPMRLLRLQSPLKILLVNSMVPRNTKAMVFKVAQLRNNHPSVVQHIMDSIEDISKTCLLYLNELGEDFYGKLYDLADLNHNLLVTLGVSHCKLEKIRRICLQDGVHGKLTGAGGGGYFYAFVDPKLPVDGLIEKLQQKGFEANVVELGGPGVQIC